MRNTDQDHFIHRIDRGRAIDLYNMDCLKGMKKFVEHGSLDIVVTSPPYNLGIRYSKYIDTIPREQYLKWMERVFVAVKDRLKLDGSVFLNIGSKPSDPWGPFDVAQMMRKHFHLQNVIHWIKSIHVENRSYDQFVSLSVGHYKPINSDRFLNDNHEYIFHFTLDPEVKLVRLSIGVPYKDGSNIGRWKKGEQKRCRGNCWFIPYETINSREKDRPHPASYPERLAEWCIRLHGYNERTVVLDPFMGIGNTSLACRGLKINCIGFELDWKYFEKNIESLSDL
jgi:site-specific DNA-methyltransferase (adenine-specific)